MLIKRLVTAAVLLTIVLTVILALPFWVFKTLLVVALLLAAWEFQQLFNYGLPTPQPPGRSLDLIAILLLGFMLSDFLNMHWLWWLAVVWWLVTVPLLLWRYTQDIQNRAVRSGKSGCDHSGKLLAVGDSCCAICWQWLNRRKVILSLAALMFITCFSAIVDIYNYLGRIGVLYLLSITILADSAAFIVGRTVGRHKLAALISPGKTVEGAVAGVLAVILLAIAGQRLILQQLNQEFIQIHLSWSYWLLLALIVALAAIVGDLFESMLKRLAQVKDSGKLLPGHGGVYDRLDSLLAVAPLFAIGLSLTIC